MKAIIYIYYREREASLLLVSVWVISVAVILLLDGGVSRLIVKNVVYYFSYKKCICCSFWLSVRIIRAVFWHNGLVFHPIAFDCGLILAFDLQR